MTVSVNYEMPASEYHAHPAVNQSRLKDLAKANTPRHFQASLGKSKPEGDNLVFGQAFHKLLLEPETYEGSILVWDGTATRAQKYYKFAAENPDKIVILEKEAEILPLMAEAFRTHPLSRGLLIGAKIETTIMWVDPTTQIECKARPDIMHDDIVWDVKSARDASLRGFNWAIDEFEYDRQSAWYLDGASQALGRPIKKFGFIVIEKTEPFEVQAFLCDDQLIEKGRAKNARDLAIYANCIRTGNWPGYPTSIQTVTGREQR